MQPPQPPGPYGGPPYPPPGPPGQAGPPPFPRPGPPPYSAAPHPPGPPAPRPPRGRAPLFVVGLLAVVLAGGGIGATLLMKGSDARGRFKTQPGACPLLTKAQIGTYAPGDVADTEGDGDFCEWNAPMGSTRQIARVIVATEIISHDTGGVPTDGDASRILGIRRRQHDRPGTTIRPLGVGDESFLACGVLPASRHHDCLAYVRVSNAVFSVEFESYYGTADPESAVKTLATEAVQNLPRS
jgi:hypothetical protein